VAVITVLALEFRQLGPVVEVLAVFWHTPHPQFQQIPTAFLLALVAEQTAMVATQLHLVKQLLAVELVEAEAVALVVPVVVLVETVETVEAVVLQLLDRDLLVQPLLESPLLVVVVVLALSVVERQVELVQQLTPLGV
jgi:hypothetical protein